ncbi:UDP-N-acetylmuramate dehydrogenase [Caldicoprobacter guelmensis]|uniref:UDP-N-acetylmuramate dehydrogenase n=1 Tax=Caldicoprobacter guelmensis TaxID=1170224 RepID=UPI00195EDDCC|nr:UDP-N-acetylmuramate dehydrogenase [Caldicoprobacter guelmensis]MBM7581556.1 UDP-N-acetylmuramate dehydrogenase [Caldicoprobacter guelmensis]
MNIHEVYRELSRVIPGEQLLKDESMKNHTSFKIGGPADLMVLPSEVEHIRHTLKACQKWGVPFIVMGNGSNLLVRDKGIRGVVIKIAGTFNGIWVEGCRIRAQSGALLSVLSKKALQAELRGLEFASGIPGTLGGAIAMNAGAYGGEMKDVVEWVKVMDYQGEELCLTNAELEFGYRTSIVQKKGFIVLEAGLALSPGNFEEIRETMVDLTRKRQEKQPLSLPSAGSVFMRPPGHFAGKLIEDVGLKGFRIGDAQVSEKHAGFIVNLGNATAKDVLDLIEFIQQKVREKYGVELKPEIKVVGEG